MSNVSKRRREGSRTKIKVTKESMGDHKEFLKRITKSLYYGQLPTLPCLSFPVTEISCALWSSPQRGRSLRRLHADAAARLARAACVSPCALVLALLYLERLNACNPDYLASAAPADLFLVSLMVGNKFLQDDGEDDDVMCSEWAASGGLELDQLKKLELEFLDAINWNVYVSEKSFEAGLGWLERQVALQQARLRGFFTYGDLAAGARLAPELLRAAAAAAALALAACLAALLAPRAAGLPAGNGTLPAPVCAAWAERLHAAGPRTNYDADWLEPWGSPTSVVTWLYRSSLVNPMQRWLERMSEYADEPEPTGRCEGGAASARCVRQWLNLSKLSALAASVADR